MKLLHLLPLLILAPYLGGVFFFLVALPAAWHIAKIVGAMEDAFIM